jgi:hypothetical protein
MEQPTQPDELVFEDKPADLGGAQRVPPVEDLDFGTEVAKMEPSSGEQPEGSSVLGTVVDIGKGIVAGAESAVGGLRETARGIADATGLSDLVGDRETNAQPLEHKAPQPEHAAGKITADLAQLTIGYMASPVKAVGYGSTIVKSAVGTGIVADPNRERLSNLLAENSWLEPIFSHLAQDPSDSVLVSKSKAMLEDAMTTAIAQPVFSMLHLGAVKAWESVSGKVSPVAKAVEKEAAAAIQKVEASSQSSTNGLHAFEPKAAAKDIDLSMAVPGTKNLGEQVIPFDKIRPGHALDTEKAQLSLGKYQRKILEEPDTISGTIVTKNLDGTYTTVSGNARHEALKLAGYQGVKTTVIEEAGTRMAAQEAALQRMGKVMSANGDTMVPLKPADLKRLGGVMTKMVERTFDASPADAVVAGHVKGAVNPAHLKSSERTLDAISEVGKIARPYMKLVEPKSMEDTHALAAILGEDPVQLSGRLRVLRGALEDADDVALGARQVLQNYAQDFADAARRAVISGDPEAEAIAVTAFKRQIQFQSDLSAVATGGGRLLRSFGEDVGAASIKNPEALLADPKRMKDLLRIAAATNGDAEKVALLAKYAAMGKFEKIVGTHNEFWMGAGLLSRFTTQTVNIGSTALNNLMQPASMVIGGGFQVVRRNDWTQIREGLAIYNGLRTSFFDSMQVAGRVFMSGAAEISQSGTMEQKVKYISALAYNMNPDNFAGKMVDLFGNAVRFSFRGLTAGDEFFKQIGYRARLSARYSREGADLVRAGSLPKKDLAKYIQDNIDKAFNTKGAAIDDAAMKYAEKAAFVNDLKGSTWGDYATMGEMVANLAGNPVMRGTLLPFVKTPTNIMRTTFEYTPVIGQMRRQFWTDVAKGGEDGAMAMGKLTMGAGFYTGAVMLALEGRITGAPPAPGMQTPPGFKPYSFVIMDENGKPTNYIPYQRIAPIGNILGLTADFTQLAGKISTDDGDKLAHSMVMTLANNLISQTYLRSLTEFFSIFSGYNSEAKVERYLQNRAGSYVPGALAQFNWDEGQREVRSMLDAMIARVPGLSQTLPPKRDYLGEIKPVTMGLPWSLISPVPVSDAKPDKVMEELARLSSSDAQIKFSEPPHKTVLAGKEVDLKEVTNKNGVTAYDRMLELIGTVKPAGETKTFRSKLESVIEDQRYKQGNDGSTMFPGLRANMIKAEEMKYRKAAYEKVVEEYRDELGLPRFSPVPVIQGMDKANRSLSKAGQELLQYGAQ